MKKSLYIFLLFILFTAVSCMKDEQAYTTSVERRLAVLSSAKRLSLGRG